MLIVLADKNPYDLQALQAGLSAPDREILIVPDGENILTVATARQADVVVMGSSLGQMGGLGVARELKMLADTGEIRAPKIIVILERQADSWIANWSRCDAWLVKPVDAAALDSLIGDLTGAKQGI